MLKKTICSVLAASALLLVGCDNSADSVDGSSANDNSDSTELKSLAEIRTETKNVSALDRKFDNLDLSETYFYVPEVDRIDDFSIYFDASIEEKEKWLLDAAEWMSDGPAEKSNVIYRDFKANDTPLAELNSDAAKDEYFFVYYKDGKIDLGVNIGGSYIYAANSAVDEFPSKIESTPRFIDSQNEPIEEFFLLPGEKTDASFGVQDSEIAVSDAAAFMKSKIEGSALYNDALKIVPNRAKIYNVGEKNGINIVFSYEYNGVLLDYHNYIYDLETEDREYDAEKKGISFNASMVWKDQLDQLYGMRLFTIEPKTESADEFVSLEDFLSMVSEKLTGNTEFVIDSVELLYGIEFVYPEEFYTAPDTEKFNIPALGMEMHPMWAAYISHTGTQESPAMCVSMDAVSGKFEVHSSHD